LPKNATGAAFAVISPDAGNISAVLSQLLVDSTPIIYVLEDAAAARQAHRDQSPMIQAIDLQAIQPNSN
jgi:hypothetical protein